MTEPLTFSSWSEVHDWAGYPVLAKLTFFHAFLVYEEMCREADRLRWPWQRSRRQDIRKNAAWLMRDSFDDAGGAKCAEVTIYSAEEAAFTRAYETVMSGLRRGWEDASPPEGADEDELGQYWASKQTAFWALARHDQYEKQRRAAREKIARVKPHGYGGFIAESQ